MWWSCKFKEPENFNLNRFMPLINCVDKNNVNSRLTMWDDKTISVTCPDKDKLQKALSEFGIKSKVECLGEE